MAQQHPGTWSTTRGGFLRAAGAVAALGAAATTGHVALAEQSRTTIQTTAGGKNMAYVEVEPDVRIFAEDWGSGKTIVFIHGWPVSHQNWEYQLTQLPQQGYRCVALDLRGFGDSDKPWGPHDFDVHADDLKKVLTALDLQNVTLVGHSMGGAIALHYMGRHGDRVAKLVLAGAAAPLLTRRPDFPQGQDPAAFDGLIAGLNADRPATLAGFGSQFFHTKVSPAFQAWFNGLGQTASPHATLEGMAALRDSDLRPDMIRVTVPTLILHGVNDRIAPLALTGEILATGIKGAQIVRFAQSGHGLFYDEKEKFNQELLNFAG
jgi:pimeloyl-ACP methyl ester carboxylesterase